MSSWLTPSKVYADDFYKEAQCGKKEGGTGIRIVCKDGGGKQCSSIKTTPLCCIDGQKIGSGPSETVCNNSLGNCYDFYANNKCGSGDEIIASPDLYSDIVNNNQGYIPNVCAGAQSDVVAGSDGFCYKKSYVPGCEFGQKVFGSGQGEIRCCLAAVGADCTVDNLIKNDVETCSELKTSSLKSCYVRDLTCDWRYGAYLPAVGSGSCELVPSKVAQATDASFTQINFQGTCPSDHVDTAIGCIPTKDFKQTLGFVLQWLFLAAGGIIIALVIKNGFTLLTSAGNPEKLKEVRESVTAIITGVLLIIFALTILKIVGADILGLPGF